MANQNTSVLQDMCYPTRNAIPSCIRLLDDNGAKFKLRPHFINVLPKFLGNESEDAYIFISELEKVFLMIKIRELSENAIKHKFIPFVLKGKAKR